MVCKNKQKRISVKWLKNKVNLEKYEIALHIKHDDVFQGARTFVPFLEGKGGLLELGGLLLLELLRAL